LSDFWLSRIQFGLNRGPAQCSSIFCAKEVFCPFFTEVFSLVNETLYLNQR
jgi:hypothetical protein